MNVSEFRSEYEKLAAGKENRLVGSIKDEFGKNCIYIDDMKNAIPPKPMKVYLIILCFLFAPFGWVILLAHLVKFIIAKIAADKAAKDPDMLYLNRLIKNTNMGVWESSYGNSEGFSKLKFGFITFIDAAKDKQYSNCFYKENADQKGFHVICADPIFVHVIGSSNKDFGTLILPQVARINTEFELTKENVISVTTISDVKIKTNSGGSLAGALVGAGLSKALGGSAALGAYVGSGMSTSSTTSTEKIVQTLLTTREGYNIYFDGTKAYTYFANYFKVFS